VAEPEDVLADAALHATAAVRDIWHRRAHRDGAAPGLPQLRRRLELLIGAVFSGAPEIGIAEPPAPLSWLARLAHHGRGHLAPSCALPTGGPDRIRLPETLDDVGAAGALSRYRLLALEQAARVTRGTFAQAPSGDRLLRDLYLLAEAAAIDSALVSALPRLETELRAARHEAAAQRPPARRLSAREGAVEDLLSALLAADPASPPDPFPLPGPPEASRAWAEAYRATFADLTGRYRGAAPVAPWGGEPPAPDACPAAGAGAADEEGCQTSRVQLLPRRPRARTPAGDEDDPEPGMWMVRADDLQEKAEDPAGLQRPADRDEDAAPGELADALSELPEAPLIQRPGRVAEVLVAREPVPRAASLPGGPTAVGLAYPEWDWRAARYRLRAATVRERPAESGDVSWVETARRRHGPTLRRVRRDFDRLRPRRQALRRQRDGAELDLEAAVAAWSDRRAGATADERWYLDIRPRRRDAAITLLLDASASTDGWITGTRRIIDAEKETLLIASEALAALGDRHAVLAFSSAGPARVTVQVLKRFDESAGTGEVQRRIASLEPGGYTRTGAAVRHATAALLRESARHRLLLLISDGRPNDVDEYEGRYGVEDSRAAVLEARLLGVLVFCLTVDREAPQYASRIFGRDFAVLPRPERLPLVLTGVLRDLVRGG
jgi:nitric oxide reductase NorD protein